jgi:hypothetical protein
MKKQPNNIVSVKIIIILVPIIIILYLLNMNFLIGNEFNHYHDIGGVNNYLVSEDRISEKYDIQRDLIDGLVYFEVQPPIGYQKIKINVRIKDNFPENEEFLIGVRNKKEWGYNYHIVYTKTKEEKGWMIVETIFDVNEDNINLINNGQLSFVLSTPHLAKEEYKNYTIPIDWINITIYKPGLL